MKFIERNYFLLRKLHVISGLIPVGIFLLIHLTINSFALISPEAYNQKVAFMDQLPFLGLLEVFLIMVPILYHGLYGLWIVFIAKNNVGRFSYYQNWAFYLQRITGVITFLFLIYHVWTTRLAKLFFHAEISYDFMSEILSNPLILGWYIVGALAAMYHFANGIWAFFIDLGITSGPKSQKIFATIAFMLFIVLSILVVRIILAF